MFFYARQAFILPGQTLSRRFWKTHQMTHLGWPAQVQIGRNIEAFAEFITTPTP
jgi:hypothetical protein